MSRVTIFDHNAKLLRELKKSIEASVAHRDVDDDHRSSWLEACHRFHESFDKLAFPGGLERQFRLLREHDSDAIEMAIRFLEADPWFFRSGYIKQELIAHLRRVRLTDNQQERLRTVILDRIEGEDRREFRRYCQLARLLETPAFREAVLSRVESRNTRVARHARWVLQALISTAPPNHLLQRSAG
jgi:hypothetical protein